MQYISLVVNLIPDSPVPSGSQLSLLQKVCKTVNTKRGMVYFGSQFQMFLPMTSWPCCFWDFDQTIFHGSRHQAEEISGFMAHRKQGNNQKFPVSSTRSLDSSKFHQFLNNTKEGNKPSMYKLSGGIQDRKFSKCACSEKSQL